MKTAIVTGSTGLGIGRSAALSLARDGYNIIVNYRSDEKRAKALCAEIEELGSKAFAVKADVFNEQQCDNLISESLGHFGRIDALIIGPGADFHSEDIEELLAAESLDDMIREVAPIYYLIPKALKTMRKQKSGSIIGIASNPAAPSPSYAYNTAKNARIEAMMGIVNKWWDTKVTINVIAPGPVEHFESSDDAMKAAKEEKHFNRVTPQDVAEMVSYLCSEKGRYITGNVIKFYF